ncbi:MAG: branched-chain amino acid ABC transporter permease [Candidatus Thorarchaeota archaeon]
MRKNFRDKVKGVPHYLKDWIHTFRGGVTVFLLIILIILPIVSRDPYVIGIFITFMIYTLFAASWDFLAGIVGQVSFGHAMFLGVAGYVTSYFVKYFFLPWWLSLICGAIIAVLFGMIIGAPALRLKGPYLALGTLSMSLILYQLFLMGSLAIIWEASFGTQLFGAEGVSGIPPISSNPSIEYIATFIIMCIVLIFLTYLTKSKLGTIFKAIRDDETGTRTSGVNTTKYKILAFMISGFVAGIAGGLFVLHFRGVNPGIFQPLYSFFAIIIAALGGLTTISGSALGAFIFIFLSEALRYLEDIPFIGVIGAYMEPLFIFSVFLIIVIRFAEHGLLKPALERFKDLWDALLGR